MTKIHQLPSDLINKIAAGEVVERPASVVKELVENALDAKATRIAIEVENAGLTKITVTDDGEGMDASDVRLSIDRHATSKINSLEDLSHITSFGFRGEALSTISAVSLFTIKSKQKTTQLGYQIHIRNAGIEKESAVGMPNGTQVVVSDLFYNVPARKKFLKTAGTEFRHIVDIITQIALTHPTTGFALYHNKKTVFELSPNQQTETRIMQLIGKETFSAMIPILVDHPHIQVSGFIGKPPLFADSAQKQFLFVNNRPVRDRLIAAAVREGYGTLLPARNLPLFIIYIQIPSDMVDVNVHPRKEEVKFINGNTLFSLVKGAVNHALQPHGFALSPSHEEDMSQPSKIADLATHERYSENSGIRESRLPRAAIESLLYSPSRMPQSITEQPLVSSAQPTPEVMREIVQVQCLYLVLEHQEKLLVVDQHAAHERILYEEYLKNFESKKDTSQPLLIEQTIELTPSEVTLYEEFNPQLTQLGFNGSLKNRVLSITHIPAQLTQKNISRVLSELFADLSQDGEVRKVDNQNQKIIASLACRSSVMAGEKLDQSIRSYIVSKLFETSNYLTCPHGRPTHLYYSKDDLAKLFKRI